VRTRAVTSAFVTASLTRTTPSVSTTRSMSRFQRDGCSLRWKVQLLVVASRRSRSTLGASKRNSGMPMRLSSSASGSSENENWPTLAMFPAAMPAGLPIVVLRATR